VRSFRFHQVDVFADRPLAGNPLAVFPEAEGLTVAEMQAIAREMNLSETTFVTPANGRSDARVRIFTPTTELPFAGHPAVGTAWLLVRLGAVAPRSGVTPVVLELGVGPTLVEVETVGGVAVGATVHQGPPRFLGEVPRPAAAAVLSLAVDDLDPALPPALVGTGLEYVLVPLRSGEALGRCRLDPSLLGDFEHEHGEVYPSAFTGEEDPWVEARGLFPAAGIPEDPATGSAAGPLAAYLARAGRLAVDQRRVVLQGARMGRPSLLTVAVAGSGGRFDDVLVGGRVQPVLRGELTLP
jgi:trans-2,3-dihydro-3-hydroxyanthranilate isomerase